MDKDEVRDLISQKKVLWLIMKVLVLNKSIWQLGYLTSECPLPHDLPKTSDASQCPFLLSWALPIIILNLLYSLTLQSCKRENTWYLSSEHGLLCLLHFLIPHVILKFSYYISLKNSKISTLWSSFSLSFMCFVNCIWVFWASGLISTYQWVYAMCISSPIHLLKNFINSLFLIAE